MKNLSIENLKAKMEAEKTAAEEERLNNLPEAFMKTNQTNKNSEEYKFVIQYTNSTEEDYEDVSTYEAAEKYFNELKGDNDIESIEVYYVVDNSWENKDPNYIIFTWSK